MKISKNSISISGEFAVLAQLALRGIDANLTLGNTKSVDIIASDPEAGTMFKLEVKTSYDQKPSVSKLFGRGYAWIMNDNHERIGSQDLFYCFVNIEQDANQFRFFIVPSAIVARYVRKSHQLWLNQPSDTQPKHVDSRVRNFRLGVDDSGYVIETPLAKDYENRWQFA